MTNISSLEKAVGYSFRDKELLLTALRNPSLRSDCPEGGALEDNQRLEFLGDAVLGLLSAELLFDRYGNEDEGMLTMRRSCLVSGAALVEIARKIDLGRYVQLGRNSKMYNSKYLADTLEAVFGAAWLDGGADAVRAMFVRLGFYDRRLEDPKSANPKGELQEYFQHRAWGNPSYIQRGCRGSGHAPVFEVRVETPEGLGADGEGNSRRAAESNAAEKLLAILKGER